MQFTTRKKRPAPTVIIVSLIDVLIVVLIFLMVTTTFKQLPAIKLALPESKQPKTGASEHAPLVVTISKEGMLFLKTDPVTLDTLQKQIAEAVHLNPNTTVAIRADTETQMGKVIRVMDAAHAANVKGSPSVFIRPSQ